MEPSLHDEIIIFNRDEALPKTIIKEPSTRRHRELPPTFHNDNSGSKLSLTSAHENARAKKTFNEFFSEDPVDFQFQHHVSKKEKNDDVYLTEVNFSEEERRQGVGRRRKINVKNTYIKKINSLIVIDQCKEYHSEIR